jgi:hypothetical protein
LKNDSNSVNKNITPSNPILTIPAVLSNSSCSITYFFITKQLAPHFILSSFIYKNLCQYLLLPNCSIEIPNVEGGDTIGDDSSNKAGTIIPSIFYSLLSEVEKKPHNMFISLYLKR